MHISAPRRLLNLGVGAGQQGGEAGWWESKQSLGVRSQLGTCFKQKGKGCWLWGWSDSHGLSGKEGRLRPGWRCVPEAVGYSCLVPTGGRVKGAKPGDVCCAQELGVREREGGVQMTPLSRPGTGLAGARCDKEQALYR